MIVRKWPELIPYIEAFKHRDYGTFMHSVAVFYAAHQLMKDLFLRFNPDKKFMTLVNQLSPFWFWHDIGKTATDKNMEVAQEIVHPADFIKRPIKNIALHITHPQMSGDLLRILSQQVDRQLRPLILKWAQLSNMHDYRMNKFIPNTNINQLSVAEKFALFLFSLSDNTIAMALPRPNRTQKQSKDKIKSTLFSQHFEMDLFKQLFPNQNLDELKHYILSSLLSSVDTLYSKYTDSMLTANPFPTDEKKSNLIDNLVDQTRKESLQFWEATIALMDDAGVFNFKENY